MGRGKRRQLSSSEQEAVLAVSSFLAGGSPLNPLERGVKAHELNSALHAVDPGAYVQIEERGNWLYFRGHGFRDYTVVGKYLYFDKDPERLVPAAVEALNDRGFHVAKASRFLGQWPKHVLCVYYKDDTRLEEMRALAERHGLEYGGWKTDEQSRREAEEQARHG